MILMNKITKIPADGSPPPQINWNTKSYTYNRKQTFYHTSWGLIKVGNTRIILSSYSQLLMGRRQKDQPPQCIAMCPLTEQTSCSFQTMTSMQMKPWASSITAFCNCIDSLKHSDSPSEWLTIRKCMQTKEFSNSKLLFLPNKLQLPDSHVEKG